MTEVSLILKLNRNELIQMEPKARVDWLRTNSGMPLILCSNVLKMSTEKFTRWLDINIKGDLMAILSFDF